MAKDIRYWLMKSEPGRALYRLADHKKQQYEGLFMGG